MDEKINLKCRFCGEEFTTRIGYGVDGERAPKTLYCSKICVLNAWIRATNCLAGRKRPYIAESPPEPVSAETLNNRIKARRKKVSKMHSNGLSAEEIAKVFGCTKNTIYRDLRLLRTASPKKEAAKK